MDKSTLMLEQLKLCYPARPYLLPICTVYESNIDCVPNVQKPELRQHLEVLQDSLIEITLVLGTHFLFIFLEDLEVHNAEKIFC